MTFCCRYTRALRKKLWQDPDSVTLVDLLDTVARLGLNNKEAVDEEEEAMKHKVEAVEEEEEAMKQKAVVQLREWREREREKDRQNQRAREQVSPRRPGRDKGTILWRVQPEFGDVLVRDPKEDGYERRPGDLTFLEAVKAAKPGARIFVRGTHSWTGHIELDKCIQIVGAGAWVTKLTGRWWLQNYPNLSEEAADMDTMTVFSSVRPIVAGFSGVELTHVAGRDRALSLVGNYMAETVVAQVYTRTH
jgi:hypothetical protein